LPINLRTQHDLKIARIFMLSNNYLRRGWNLIKNAIPIISKATIGITISIVIITLGGLISSFWFSRSGLIPLAASFGGMVVFLGLWIEKEADEEGKKEEHLPPGLRFKAQIGWWVLMVGILVEIGTGAGLAAFDVYENTKTAKANANADPLNQPIALVTANVELFEAGTNRAQVVETTTGTHPVPFIKLLVGSGANLKAGWPIVLMCSSCERTVLVDGSGNPMGISWNLEFGSGELGHVMNVVPTNSTVKDAKRWDTVELDGLFLPKNTVIGGGDIMIFANSTKMSFAIPEQNTLSLSNDWTQWMQKGRGALNPPRTNTVTVVSW
jgi:flagellar basal body-associated protein FliL